MAAPPAQTARVVAGPEAARDLLRAAADPAVRAVLVHQGVELGPGAVGRLLAELDRPGRRLVRVLADGTACYLLDRALLLAALGRMSAGTLVADPPDLDHRLADVLGLPPADMPTDVSDLTTGAWRHWVDGAVVGVRRAGPVDDGWAAAVARRHSPAVRARGAARRLAGRARREVARRRDRRTGQR